MKNKISIIGIALLIIILALAVFGYLTERNKRMLAEKKLLEPTGIQSAIIERYKDLQGLEHVQIPADEHVYTKSDIKALINIPILDTISKALNIKEKQVVDLTRINFTLKAENLKASKALDSQQRLTYYYKDKYVNLAFRPSADSTDKGEFDFEYNADITVTQYWKRKWLLAKQKSFVDIYSNDKRATINGVERLTVAQNEPVFGLRLQARGIYSFTQNRLFPGVGLEVDFKKASVLGYGYYDTETNLFRPFIGLKYDLIRF